MRARGSLLGRVYLVYLLQLKVASQAPPYTHHECNWLIKRNPMPPYGVGLVLRQGYIRKVQELQYVRREQLYK